MRRKEERSKQGHTNNKAKQHSTPKAVTSHVHILMRDEKEGRKKQARSNKQQGRAHMYMQLQVHVCKRTYQGCRES